MKKVTSLFLAAIMLISFAIPSFAEENELKKSISAAKKYLLEADADAETFDRTLSYAEAELIGDTTKIYIVKADVTDAKKLAEYILIQKTFGESIDLDDGDYADRLILLQKEDGSFGTAEATVYAVAALFASGKKTDKSEEKPYDEVGAVNFIVNSQAEDGSIGDKDVSAKAAAVLWQYKTSENAANALEKLEKYFIKLTESDDVNDVAAGLRGLVDKNYGTQTSEMTAATEKLIAFQKEDGSFGDIETTQTVFEALESVRYTVTPFNAVLNGVKFANSGIDFSELKPMIILYAVLAVCSVALWVFIMKRKPNRGTLEDAKKRSEEKYEKIP